MNTAKQRGAFISYSRKDKEFALEFTKELKSSGYSVWLDQLDIPTGARWDDEVEKALHEHDVFLIILTPASASSENVKDEIGYAIDHGKRIMPVLLEECNIPLRLRRFQYVDFTKMEFREGIQGAKRLLEILLDERPKSMATVISKPEPQKAQVRKAASRPPLPAKNKPSQLQWVGIGAGIVLSMTCLGILGAIIIWRASIFPSFRPATPVIGEVVAPVVTEMPIEAPVAQPPTEPPTEAPVTQPPTEPPTEEPVTQPPTEPPTEELVTEPPPVFPVILWTLDSTGVCRGDTGGYPRWSEYNWALSQCEETCKNDPNCQGFAMSKEKNYCQLFGANGQYAGSGSTTQIAQGDRANPKYACYLKSTNQSILSWTMDSTGVCRDDTGGYPRWSEYNWTLPQCEEACRNDSNCQGFAMSKEKNYCQLFGANGRYEASKPGTQITRGDRAHPTYACYLRTTSQFRFAWSIDSTGVCRDAKGGYPRWSEYNWPLSQCEHTCRNDPNCQGFAMSKERDYCQLFGANGQNAGSGSTTQITQGDSSHRNFICFVKR